MNRQRGWWVSATLALTYLFLVRDAGHPDAVSGATRRAMPARPSASQPPASSLPPAMSMPAYNGPAPVASPPAYTPAVVAPDPGEVLVSAPVTPPPVRPRAIAPVLSTSSNRTFEGKVESVVAEGSGSGARLIVVIVNTFGEHFKFVMEPDTPVYQGDEPAPETRLVAPGDQIFVNYILRKDNLAVRVKIEI